jgi:ABC-type sugar transport system permease subunit
VSGLRLLQGRAGSNLRRERRTALLLILPSLAVVFGIILYPLLRTLWTSLFDVNSPFPGSYPFVGLGNYRRTLTNPDFWAAVRRTAYFTIVSTLLELGLGILLGLLMNVQFRGRWLLRSIMVLPWALPTIVNGTMWRWIFNPDYGALNALRTQMHILSHYRSWLGSPSLALNMVVLADVWKNTPLAAFLVLAGLQTIPKELFEAARVDGAGPIRTFFRITLPLLRPTILIILVVRTIEAFKVFDIIYVMTRGGPANGTQTVAYYAYLQAFSNQLFGYGAALAYMMALFILGIALVYIRLLRQEVEF